MNVTTSELYFVCLKYRNSEKLPKISMGPIKIGKNVHLLAQTRGEIFTNFFKIQASYSYCKTFSSNLKEETLTDFSKLIM